MSRSVCAIAVALSLTGFASVAAQPKTTTALAISAGGVPVTSVGAGTVITLTATVLSGNAHAGGGQVNFCDADAKFCEDIHLLATVQIATAGQATFKLRTGVGTHHYKAVFLGTRNDTASVSAPAAITVTPSAPANSPTTTVLTPTGHPGDYTLTATVNTTFNLPPTGTVSFFDITNANYPLGTATLSPGLGTISLQAVSSIDPGGTPVIADFNGDGIPDLALSSAIYLGKGDGTFTYIPFNGVPILSADFNNDGIPDLAAAGNPLTILLGKGDGTFTAAPDSIFSNASAVVTGDVNRDGTVDLVVSNGSDIVTYFGRGDGTFTQGAQPTIIRAASIYSADFNQDGNLDLAVTNPMDPNLTILLGNGDGTFTVIALIDVNGNESPLVTATVVIADFNSDGIPDLAVITTFEPNNIFIVFGKGNGTFAKPSELETYYYNFLAAADFNSDGNVDFAVVYQFSGSFNPANIVILYGNGDGTFSPGPVITDPGNPTAAFAGDFNGDGYPDIAASELNGSISIFATVFTATSTAAVDNINVVGTGTHFVDAQYIGDAPYLGSLSPPVPITADTVPVSLALSVVPPDGITVGQSASITASLSPNTAQNHDATGIVTFFSNDKMLGTTPVTEGTATLSTTALAVGDNELVATYPGDINFRPATARDLLYTVVPLKAQTIAFPQPASPISVQSAPIALVATASSGLPVTFKLVSGPATLAGSVLTFTGLGTVVVAADQPGNAVYAPAAEVTRSILVTPPAVVSLSAAPILVFLLSPVTLTAAIAPYGSSATGTITFLDGNQSIGTASAQGGVATISLNNLPVGPHNITALWSGDAGYVATSSPVAALTVEDFSLAFSDPQVTIVHGGTATLTLRLTPVGGPAMAGPIAVSLSGEPDGSRMTVTPSAIATGASSGTVTVVIATPNYPTGPFAYNIEGKPGTSSGIVLALIAFGGLLLPFGRRTNKLLARRPWNSALLAIAIATLVLGAIGCGSGWSTEVFQIRATATSGALSHTATATLTSKCSNGQSACPVVGK